jgi:hypothetical protein
MSIKKQAKIDTIEMIVSHVLLDCFVMHQPNAVYRRLQFDLKKDSA